MFAPRPVFWSGQFQATHSEEIALQVESPLDLAIGEGESDLPRPLPLLQRLGDLRTSSGTISTERLPAGHPPSALHVDGAVDHDRKASAVGQIEDALVDFCVPPKPKEEDVAKKILRLRTRHRPRDVWSFADFRRLIEGSWRGCGGEGVRHRIVEGAGHTFGREQIEGQAARTWGLDLRPEGRLKKIPHRGDDFVAGRRREDRPTPEIPKHRHEFAGAIPTVGHFLQPTSLRRFLRFSFGIATQRSGWQTSVGIRSGAVCEGLLQYGLLLREIRRLDLARHANRVHPHRDVQATIKDAAIP